ncbi:siroheme synthase [Lewinellaceae bacterium SD302]|nr:siroheme synthase [Lewinellaceae bacterium SD302]
MNNPLYPIFLRLDNLRLLVVGAGEVGEEKLRFILKSSPNAQVTIVAPWMGDELRALLDSYNIVGDNRWQIVNNVEEQTCPHGESGNNEGERKDVESGQQRAGSVTFHPRTFLATDVADHDLIVAATNLETVNHAVHRAAKKYGRLVNVADTPDLCDFYLGSIVTRGPLKVAISTNGQSPTFAKRFRQWLESSLPAAETPQLLDNLKIFRDRLKGDFGAKVSALNELTKGLLADPADHKDGLK